MEGLMGLYLSPAHFKPNLRPCSQGKTLLCWAQVISDPCWRRRDLHVCSSRRPVVLLSCLCSLVLNYSLCVFYSLLPWTLGSFCSCFEFWIRRRHGMLVVRGRALCAQRANHTGAFFKPQSFIVDRLLITTSWGQRWACLTLWCHVHPTK